MIAQVIAKIHCLKSGCATDAQLLQCVHEQTPFRADDVRRPAEPRLGFRGRLLCRGQNDGDILSPDVPGEKTEAENV